MEPFAQQTQESAVQAGAAGLMLPRFPLPRKGPAPTLREQGGEALALAGIAHDARNLVTALGLCAELISEPGVFTPRHGHFAGEIRSIAEAWGSWYRGSRNSPAQRRKSAAVWVTDLAKAVGRWGACSGPLPDP